METKHTPGPWQISRSAAGKNGTSLFIWRNDEGPNSPEDSGNTNYARIAQHIHLQADAHLIAAAPDLLDALEMLVDAIEQFKEFSDESMMEPEEAAYQRDALNKARAAIAKAKQAQLDLKECK